MAIATALAGGAFFHPIFTPLPSVVTSMPDSTVVVNGSPAGQSPFGAVRLAGTLRARGQVPHYQTAPAMR